MFIRKQKKLLSLIITLALILFNSSGFIGTQVVKAAGTGTPESPYTVAQAYAIQDSSIATVQGYIVGQPISATTVLTSAFTGDTAISIADTANETDTTKKLYVQMPATPGSFRADFALKTNPTNITFNSYNSSN